MMPGGLASTMPSPSLVSSSSRSLSKLASSPSLFPNSPSLWPYVTLSARSPSPSSSSHVLAAAADNPRPRRSVASSPAKSQKYYFTTEAEEPSSSSPLTADSVPLLAGAAAALGFGFVYKHFSKNGWTLSMPKMNTGLEVGGAGAGSDKKFRRESMAKLNEFSRELRTFREVDLAGRAFGDEGFVYLAEGLAFNQSAESVDFSANGITAIGVKALSQVLPTNSFLKTLNFSGNSIGDEGSAELAGLLENNQGITKLQLNSINVGDEGAKAIAEMLKKNEHITHLELNNNVIDYAGFAALADALATNKTLRSIHINNNYGGALGGSAFAKGLEGNKSLRELHLHGNDVGNEGIRELMVGLTANKGKISSLDIGNNKIGPKGAFHVAEYIKKAKTLQWLNMYMNDIGDQGAERIAEALKRNRSITTIDLGGNNISAEGTSHLAAALKDNTTITTFESEELLDEQYRITGSLQIGVVGCRRSASWVCFGGGARPRRKRAWKTVNRKGSFAKARKLVDVISELPSAKEEIYGALDAFIAWELEFPIIAIKKALQFMAEDQQWKCVIQVIKWMLSKGQGKTMGTYTLLLQALDYEGRVEEADALWEKLVTEHEDATPRIMFTVIIAMFERHNQPRRLLQVFADMEELEIKPDIVTVERVARTYRSLGLLKRAHAVEAKYPPTKWGYRYSKRGKKYRIRITAEGKVIKPEKSEAESEAEVEEEVVEDSISDDDDEFVYEEESEGEKSYFLKSDSVVSSIGH